MIRAHAFYLRITDRTQEALEEFEPLLALEPRDAGLRTDRTQVSWMLMATSKVHSASTKKPFDWNRIACCRTTGPAALSSPRSARRISVCAFCGTHPAWIRTVRTSLPQLAVGYWYFGEAELERQAREKLRKLGATGDLQRLDAAIATMDGRPNDARNLLLQRLNAEPRDSYAMTLLANLRGSHDEYRSTLQQVTQFRSLDADEAQSDDLVDALVCLNAWLGNLDEANNTLHVGSRSGERGMRMASWRKWRATRVLPAVLPASGERTTR